MRRILLFSMPVGSHMDQLTKLLFPKEMENKVLAYMPSNGSRTNPEYTKYWNDLTIKNNSKFLFVDNTLPENSGEKRKIEQANILVITGGNTYELLDNLRKSGLDQVVINFSKRGQFIIGGFSAGAIVLSPTIASAGQPTGDDPNDLVDENIVGITDLKGLSIINFEVFPHFNPEKDSQTLEKYRNTSSNEVKSIADEEYIVLDL